MRLAIEVAYDPLGHRQDRLRALGFSYEKSLRGWRKAISPESLEEEIAKAREFGFRAWPEGEG